MRRETEKGVSKHNDPITVTCVWIISGGLPSLQRGEGMDGTPPLMGVRPCSLK